MALSSGVCGMLGVVWFGEAEAAKRRSLGSRPLQPSEIPSGVPSLLWPRSGSVSSVTSNCATGERAWSARDRVRQQRWLSRLRSSSAVWSAREAVGPHAGCGVDFVLPAGCIWPPGRTDDDAEGDSSFIGAYSATRRTSGATARAERLTLSLANCRSARTATVSRRQHAPADLAQLDRAVRGAAAQDELVAVVQERALAFRAGMRAPRLGAADRARAEEVARADRRAVGPAWASCCSGLQYRWRALVVQITSPLRTASSSRSSTRVPPRAGARRARAPGARRRPGSGRAPRPA